MTAIFSLPLKCRYEPYTMAATTKVVKTKLFIGNLDQETQTGTSCEVRCSCSFFAHCDACVCLEELTELFSAYGPVLEASVIKDYGFVVMRRARRSTLISILRFFSRSTSAASKRLKRQFLV